MGARISTHRPPRWRPQHLRRRNLLPLATLIAVSGLYVPLVVLIAR